MLILFLYYWKSDELEPSFRADVVTTAPKTIPPLTTAPKTIPPLTTAPKTIPPLTTAPITIAPTLAPITIAPTLALATVAKLVPLTVAPPTVAKLTPPTVAKLTPPTVAKLAPPTVAKLAPPTVAKLAPSTVAPGIASPLPTPKTMPASTRPMLYRFGNLQVKPSTQTYCTAGSYGGDLNACASATALFTEANLLDSKVTSFPPTKSSVKVGYLQLGTANPSYITFDELKHTDSKPIRNKNLGKMSFNYNRVENLPEIENTLRKRIDYMASKGANAIRFDEMDTCADDVCNQNNFNRVLINIANYAAMNKRMVILGNNGRYFSDPEKVTSAKALVDSRIPIAGWTVEQFPDNIKGIREIIGPSIPIFGMAANANEAYTLSNVKDNMGIVMIDGVSIYKY